MTEQPGRGAGDRQSPLPEIADDPAGWTLLTEKIARDREFRCGSYKEKCLRRRIAVRMRARGVHTFEDYARVLDADAGEYDKLMDALTINVTKLFRNYEAFDAISRKVIPELWSRPDSLRVWSAGCSSGEEPYSLAVLFRRHAEDAGDAARANRVTIVGTDIDRASLAAAQRGVYPEPAFSDTPAELRDRFFSPEGSSFAVKPEVRALARFEHRDLLLESAPSGPFHLVTCRNVLIYFDRDTQEALFQKFYEALMPGGFLVLGKVETLLGAARSMFTSIDARERIFRKPA